MEFVGLIGLAVIVVVATVLLIKSRKSPTLRVIEEQKFFYSRKDALMTTVESKFFHRLQTIANDRYYIFPQIHLSALLKNETKGTYWKAAFQRINRTSVDYVLAHKDTLQAVYVVELDDWSHDNSKRKTRDNGVERMLNEAQIPLIRFRNVESMTNEQIIEKFHNVHKPVATLPNLES